MGMDDGNTSQNARRNPMERGFGGKPGSKPSSTKKLETCTIKECYFRTKEYNKLTHMEMYKLWQLHKKHDGDGGDKDKRQLEELSSQILELQT